MLRFSHHEHDFRGIEVVDGQEVLDFLYPVRASASGCLLVLV